MSELSNQITSHQTTNDLANPLDLNHVLINPLNQVATKFIQSSDEIVSVENFGSGNINDTFLVTARAKPLSADELITSIYQKSQGNLDRFGNPIIIENEPKSYKFVLQKINTHVFKQPELVMANIRLVTEHIRHKLGENKRANQRYNSSEFAQLAEVASIEENETQSAHHNVSHNLDPIALDLENFDLTSFDPQYFNANISAGQGSQGLILPNLSRPSSAKKTPQKNTSKTTQKSTSINPNIADQVANDWVTVRVIPTQNNQDLLIDADQNHWRSLTFINHTIVLQKISESAQAYEVGYGVGYFHHLLRDLPLNNLADTLPEFHITPLYFRQYQQAHAKFTKGKHRHIASSLLPELKFCLGFVEERSKLISILEDAKSCGWLPMRVMHGDPKINNILLDESSQKAVSMIDLDTVKPGLIHYDIGDGLRSACNLMGEETEHWESVIFDIDVCQTWLRGYMQFGQNLLRPREYDFIYEAIRLISLELGLRFLTDYLAGNVYFKVSYPEQNLIRALVQLRLTESIENQSRNLRQIIREFYK
ncbi:MAG: phosphotransferase [Pseudanabaena sp. ELA607]